MNRKTFIQQACPQFMPYLDWDVDKSVRYAEKLWDRLTERGLGYNAVKPKEAPDNFYEKLGEEGKKQFTAFWNAFAYKEGRQGAAKAWYKMGEVSKDQAIKIIEAAKKTAANRDPRKSKKMAEGWLTERRYEDHQETVAVVHKPVDEKEALLAHLRSMVKMDKTGQIQKQIDELTK